MDIAEKTLQLKQDFDDVYEAGKQVGKQVGKQEETDAFWEQFQKDQVSYGSMNYIWAFAYNRFNDKTYNPPLPIICSENINSGQNMFYSSGVTDTKVPIYANSLNLGGAFYWWRKGITINKLVVQESTTYKTCFTDCIALKNITIEGVIGQTFDIHWSPLTTKSIVSIIEHLSATASGMTLTLNKTAVNNMSFPYTSEESGITYNSWNELIGSKSNWTVSTLSA